MTSVDGYKTCDYDEHRTLAAELADAFDLHERECAQIERLEARIRDLEAALRAVRDLRCSSFRTYEQDANDMRRIATAALSGARTADETKGDEHG